MPSDRKRKRSRNRSRSGSRHKHHHRKSKETSPITSPLAQIDPHELQALLSAAGVQQQQAQMSGMIPNPMVPLTMMAMPYAAAPQMFYPQPTMPPPPPFVPSVYAPPPKEHREAERSSKHRSSHADSSKSRKRSPPKPPTSYSSPNIPKDVTPQQALPHRIHVNHISFDATEEDIRRAFERSFGSIKKIDMCNAKREEGGKFRGFCFIEFDKVSSAAFALDSPPESVIIRGKPCQINQVTSTSAKDSRGQEIRLQVGATVIATPPSSNIHERVVSGGRREERTTAREEQNHHRSPRPRAAAPPPPPPYSASQPPPPPPQPVDPPLVSRNTPEKQSNKHNSDNRDDHHHVGVRLPNPDKLKPDQDGASQPTDARKATPSASPDPAVVVLSNMVETRQELDKDLYDDVKQECGKLGKVLYIGFYSESTKSGADLPKVVLEYSTMDEAKACVKAMNGRGYAQRLLQCGFLQPRLYAIVKKEAVTF